MNLDSILLTLSSCTLASIKTRIEEILASKKKEEALALSGINRERYCFDVTDLTLVDDVNEISFVKWYAKHVLNIDVPKYVHKASHSAIMNSDIDLYLFDDAKNSMCIMAGSRPAIRIHKDSKPYLIEMYRDWLYEN